MEARFLLPSSDLGLLAGWVHRDCQALALGLTLGGEPVKTSLGAHGDIYLKQG